MSRPVAIVGAGLAGLACALHLHRYGIAVRLFEASNDVGGRLRTDEVDGFLLDRGFQVFNTAYPEAQRMLDYDALNLQYFDRALTFPNPNGVSETASLYTLEQPTSPASLLRLLQFPVGTWGDKLRGAAMLLALSRGKRRRFLSRPETSTEQYLQRKGFSDDFVERLFRPFFSGVFLDRDLATSSRWFELLFNLFVNGSATLPAEGMQAIPRQLATQLPHEMVHLGTKVAQVSNRSVILESGETVLCGSTVLATSEPIAAQLLSRPLESERHGRSVRCLYFDAPKNAIGALRGSIVLGKAHGVITTFCVPSLVAPSYAPEGRHLVSVSVVPYSGLSAVELEAECRAELQLWLGAVVNQWTLIDHQLVDDALPPQRAGQFLDGPPLECSPGIYRCGDYLETSSIHGALVSGRKTADLIRRSIED